MGKFFSHIDQNGCGLSLPSWIDGISWRLKDKALIISSERPLQTLCSGIVGGGRRAARHIINRQVDYRYNHDCPAREMAEYCRTLGLEPEECAGLMTAVNIESGVLETDGENGLNLVCFITAGVGNPASAGRDAWCQALPVTPPEKQQERKMTAGTINLIVLTNAVLTEYALVNTVITATEAKTMALMDMHVRDRYGNQASGTTSDAILVGFAGTGPVVEYAGTATDFGLRLGKLIRRGIPAAITPGKADS